MMWGQKPHYYATELVKMYQNAALVYCHSYEKDYETFDRRAYGRRNYGHNLAVEADCHVRF